jgi:hypothetical protein
MLLVIADGPRSAEDMEPCGEARRIVDQVDWDCRVFKEFSDYDLGCNGEFPARHSSRSTVPLASSDPVISQNVAARDPAWVGPGRAARSAKCVFEARAMKRGYRKIGSSPRPHRNCENGADVVYLRRSVSHLNNISGVGMNSAYPSVGS